MNKLFCVLVLWCAFFSLGLGAVNQTQLSSPQGDNMADPGSVAVRQLTSAQIKEMSTTEWAQFVVKFVHQAADYVRKHGRTAAICEFNRADGAFYQRGLSILSVVCNDGVNNGIMLSDLPVPQDLFTYRYNDPLFRRIEEMVKQHPDGVWMEFKWRDPIMQKIVSERGYTMMLPKEKLCVGTTYFLSAKTVPEQVITNVPKNFGQPQP